MSYKSYKDEIDKMSAGRELDRMIAERIFGVDRNDARVGLHPDGDIEYHWGYPLGHDIAPHYSTSLYDAFMIIEKLKDRYNYKLYNAEDAIGRPVHICAFTRLGTLCTIDGGALGPALAICRAALKLPEFVPVAPPRHSTEAQKDGEQ